MSKKKRKAIDYPDYVVKEGDNIQTIMHQFGMKNPTLLPGFTIKSHKDHIPQKKVDKNGNFIIPDGSEMVVSFMEIGGGIRDDSSDFDPD